VPGRAARKHGSRDRHYRTIDQPLYAADELASLAFLTADALERVVRAVVHHDRLEARRVLRRSAALRGARREGEQAVRQMMQSCSGRTGSLRYTACRLQVVADLGAIATLVDVLARHLVANEVPRPVIHAVGADLETIGAAGAARLRALGAGIPGPGMDADYLRCGCWASWTCRSTRCSSHPTRR
jgi:hypothetical protein